MAAWQFGSKGAIWGYLGPDTSSSCLRICLLLLVLEGIEFTIGHVYVYIYNVLFAKGLKKMFFFFVFWTPSLGNAPLSVFSKASATDLWPIGLLKHAIHRYGEEHT